MGDVLTTSRSSLRRYWCIHIAQLLVRSRSVLMLWCHASQCVTPATKAEDGERWSHMKWGRQSVCQGEEGGMMSLSLSLSAGWSLLPWHVKMFLLVIIIINRYSLSKPSHIPNLKQVISFLQDRSCPQSSTVLCSTNEPWKDILQKYWPLERNPFSALVKLRVYKRYLRALCLTNSVNLFFFAYSQ